MVTRLKRNNLRLRSLFEIEMPLLERRQSFRFILVITVILLDSDAFEFSLYVECGHSNNNIYYVAPPAATSVYICSLHDRWSYWYTTGGESRIISLSEL